MTALVNKTVDGFLDELASSSPAPGGGSVAALSASLGGALCSMVCNLTRQKPGYEGVQADIEALLKRSEALRSQATSLIDEDTAAFNEVVAALRLPKATDADKERRRTALQQAYRRAADVPLRTAKLAIEVLDLSVEVARKGNKNSITDAAVAAYMAHAAVLSALLNVRINLTAIKDQQYVATVSQEITAMPSTAAEKVKSVDTIVNASL
jgi:formiminotetrahydrofolate cyclodeaminase